MTETIILVSFLAGSLVCKNLKQLTKKCLYKNEKRRLKKNLIKSFENKNKKEIKNSVQKLKDFDKKKRTNKCEKYLYEIVETDENINEYNVMNLLKDFSLINELYTNENTMKNKMDKMLEEKLKKMNHEKNLIKIRQDKLNQKNNKVKKIRRI